MLKSVRTPLGFFTLIALILDGWVMWMGSSQKQPLLLGAALALLALVLIFVFTIVWCRPHVLYHPSDLQISTINLIFPNEDGEFDVDTDKSRIEIRDNAGKKIFQFKPNLVLGHGGWYLNLEGLIAPTDSVSLYISTTDGQKWKVRAFAPYHTKQRLILDASRTVV